MISQRQTPVATNETLVLGFMGGRDSWSNENVGVGRLALKLRNSGLPRVHVETAENRRRDIAMRLVRNALDRNGNGTLEAVELDSAQVILYGQSFGGAAVVKFVRELEALGVPILLTVSSRQRGDG